MKTAMQEHIEWLKEALEIYKDAEPTLVKNLELGLIDAKYRLDIEKEQINEAYNQGQMDGFGLEEKDDYYSETFKSEQNEEFIFITNKPK